jgi:hypothetical protein
MSCAVSGSTMQFMQRMQAGRDSDIQPIEHACSSNT